MGAPGGLARQGWVPKTLTPGMKISAVNGRKYAGDVLREEITAKKALDVAVEQGSFAGTFHIDYHDGERFPHLQRMEGTPDLLSDIMRPHAVTR